MKTFECFTPTGRPNIPAEPDSQLVISRLARRSVACAFFSVGAAEWQTGNAPRVTLDRVTAGGEESLHVADKGARHIGR
jgi:hypothetical protein